MVWFKNIKDRTERMDFTITFNEEPVGLIGLLNIDHRNQKQNITFAWVARSIKVKG